MEEGIWRTTACILAILLLSCESGTGNLSREKRQVSFQDVYQMVKSAIDEANQELVRRKEVDKVMLEQGKVIVYHRR